MTAIGSAFLEVFQVGLFWLTQFYGGQVGAAIVSFGVLARLALLPFTVRLAGRARAHARSLRALQPEIARVRERWAADPKRVMTETLAVYERRGVKPVDGGVLKGSLLQAPVYIGVYQAVRATLAGRSGSQAFLWVGSLARPDVGVAVVAAALFGASALAGSSETQPAWTLAIPAVVGGIMALTMSAGFGLYLAGAGAVGTLQGLLVRRIERRNGAAAGGYSEGPFAG